MAEYFDSPEAAAEAIDRWRKEGASIAFFAKILDSGCEKWMVDFRKKDYGGAVRIVEDLTHSLTSEAPSPQLACSHCKRPLEPIESVYWAARKCAVCKRVILCQGCVEQFSRGGLIGCPTCGYHEKWDDLLTEGLLPKSRPTGATMDQSAARRARESAPSAAPVPTSLQPIDAPRRKWWVFWK